jgi:hypothetical protein
VAQMARLRGAGLVATEPDQRGGVALFIDWDNFTASVTRELPQAPLDLQPILNHARLNGPLMVCRAYGEWQYPDERYYAYRHGVDVLYAPVLPLAQAAREAQNGGKNLATMAIAVDCIDLLHQIPELEAVVLVSNDRELLPVARLARLRGKRVVVIGTPSTPQALRAAADEFVDYGALVGVEIPPAPAAPTARKTELREARPVPLRAPQEPAAVPAQPEEVYEAAAAAPAAAEVAAPAEAVSEPEAVAVGERGRSRRRRTRRRPGRAEPVAPAPEVLVEAAEAEIALGEEQEPVEGLPEAAPEAEAPREAIVEGVTARAEAQREWAEIARQIMEELERPELAQPALEELGVVSEAMPQYEAPAPGEIPPTEEAAAEWEVPAAPVAEWQEGAATEAGEVPAQAQQEAAEAVAEAPDFEPHPAVAPVWRARRRPHPVTPVVAGEAPASEPVPSPAEAPEGAPAAVEEPVDSVSPPEPAKMSAAESASGPRNADAVITEEPGEAASNLAEHDHDRLGEVHTGEEENTAVEAGQPGEEAGLTGSAARRYPRRPVRRSRARLPGAGGGAQAPLGGSES